MGRFYPLQNAFACKTDFFNCFFIKNPRIDTLNEVPHYAAQSFKNYINQTVLMNARSSHVVSLFAVIRIYAILRNYTLLYGLFF